MKLSAPIHVLKSKAKTLKREKSISLNEALDCIAKEEGFNSWSLLQSKSQNLLPQKYNEILDYLNGGDLVLIGARPRQGKTSFTIGLFVKAIQQQRKKSFYFTLSEVHRDVAGRIGIYDQSIGQDNNTFELDYSNEICAEYIIKKTEKEVKENSVIVIDYLQLLDEKRVNPPLQSQIEALKEYAREKKCIIIFISQVDREIEYKLSKRPSVDDIRLPNPLDINLMNKVIFLYRDPHYKNEADVIFAGKNDHIFKVGWNKEEIRFF